MTTPRSTAVAPVPARFVAVATAVLLLVAHCACGDDVAGPWTPYDVRLVVLGDGSPPVTPDCLADVSAELLVGLRNIGDAAWTLTLVDAAKVPESVAAAMRSGAPAVADWKTWRDSGGDKILVVVLGHDGAGYRARAVEWAPPFQSLGPSVVVEASDRRLLADAACEAACDAFRPAARIEPAAGGQSRLNVQAGALLNDTAWERWARPGDVFLPLLRGKRRDGGYDPAKPVPWTLLETSTLEKPEAGPPTVVCDVRSGLSNPLAARRRGRYEAWALAVGRPKGGTTISVQSQVDATPLADCEVFAVGPDKRARSLGKTDVAGELWIEPSGGRLQRLIIAGRMLPLAQVPILPGLEPVTTVPVAADGRLRGVEDWLTDWQTEFLDLYVRRRALMAAASVMIEQGKKPAAVKLLEQVDRLGSPAERIEALEVRRRSAETGDPRAARLLDALYAEVLTAVRALDDAAVLVDLRRRIGG